MLDVYEGTYSSLLVNVAAVVAVSLAFGGMVDAGSGSGMLESPASMSVVAESVAMQSAAKQSNAKQTTAMQSVALQTVATRQLSGELGAMAPAVAVSARGASARGTSVGSSPVLPIVSPLIPSRADLGTAALGSTTGARLLSELTRLGTTGITEFLSAYPSKIDALLASPPAAATVSGWWRGLGNSDQAAWLSAAPRVIGNLEGIPVTERSVANLRYLTETDADIRQRLTSGLPRGEKTGLTQELSVLGQVKLAVAEEAGHAARYLLQLDPADGGRAAVVIGNPDTADFVTYLVPGMNYGVKEQLVNWSATAEALYAEQKRVLRERSDSTSPAKQVATIAWIGYETPDLFSVGGLDRAESGADQLERAINGLRELRGNDQPFLSIIGHSYGSVLSLVALARGTLTVDTFTMVGSPGSASQSAADLNVNGGEVFVGEADWDPAVNSGFFGSDPGASSYGAHRLGVSGNRDALTGKWLKASFGHNEYFTPGSESLHNMALIATGYAKQVTGRSE